MPLNVAIQMDPMEKVNIAGDSSFAIMLAGQARGHKIWHYDVRELSYHADGRLTTRARPVTVQRVEGDHFSFGDYETIDLRGDIDIVLMRQDPPFDLSYITATHLLERIQPDTLVVNDPASVRNAPEKLFVLDFAEFMPPTMITRSLDDTRAFQEEHGEIVVKPLYGNAGSAVFFVGKEDRNLAALTELELVTGEDDYRIAAARGLALAILGDAEGSEAQLDLAWSNRPEDAVDDAVLRYELARAAAMAGLDDKALDMLKDELERPGYHEPPAMRLDPHFASLHDDPRFIALMERFE